MRGRRWQECKRRSELWHTRAGEGVGRALTPCGRPALLSSEVAAPRGVAVGPLGHANEGRTVYKSNPRTGPVASAQVIDKTGSSGDGRPSVSGGAKRTEQLAGRPDRNGSRGQVSAVAGDGGRGLGATFRGGSVPEVLVDHVGQGCALDEVADVLDQGGEVAGGDHGGVAGGVWGHNDVGEVPERMIGRERLDLEDVERRTGEPACAEGGHQVEVLFQAGRERLPCRISRVANLRRLMHNRGHRQARTDIDRLPRLDPALPPARAMPRPTFAFARIVLLVGSLAVTAAAAEPDEPSLEHRFEEVVQPFLKNHCLACHGAEKPEAKLDLSVYSSLRRSSRIRASGTSCSSGWRRRRCRPRKHRGSRRRTSGGPSSSGSGPCATHEARRNAGDPGPVLARRLSNAEFDYTIRDLTGVDIRPTREFPVDPANEAGFDNSGESLTMSPALVKKYLAAARLVADHLVLKPDGFDFAPHPAVTDTDRDKYCVQRIIEFYQRHRVDYADYFLAAWRFQHREALGKPQASLDDFAGEAGLSARYLATVWTVLAEPWPEAGPLGKVQALWRKLPADVQKRRTRPGAAASGCATSSSGCGRSSSRAWSKLQVQGHFRRQPAARAVAESPARRACACVIRGTAPARDLRGVLPGLPRHVLRVRSCPLLRSQGRPQRHGC